MKKGYKEEIMFEICSGVYYHYCSLDTLINILKNRNIRFGNPYKMNDAQEVAYYFDKLCERVREYADKQTDIVKKEFYEFVYDEGVRTVFEQDFKGDRVPYIWCLSKEKDLLSQWRGYAEDGCGVAIGFDIAEVLKINNSLKALEVNYFENECKKSIDDILKQYGIENVNSMDFHSMGDIYAEVEDLIKNCMEKAITFKHVSFHEEQEIRLIYDVEGEGQINGLSYRTDGKRLIPYYELSIALIKDTCIKNIVIGPKSKVNEREIENLLKVYGFGGKCEIEKSASTYR